MCTVVDVDARVGGEINNLRQEKVAATRWLDEDGQVAPPDLSFIFPIRYQGHPALVWVWLLGLIS